MRFVRMAICIAGAGLSLSCAQLVGVEDWTPKEEAPVDNLDSGLGGADGSRPDASDGDAWGVACEAGASRCVGAELQRCDDTGRWTAAAECATEALCKASESRCAEPVCELDEYRCDSEVLLKCDKTREGWDKVKSCSWGVCDALNRRCSKCLPGTLICEKDELRKCADDGYWTELVQKCAEPELCDAAKGVCLPEG